MSALNIDLVKDDYINWIKENTKMTKVMKGNIEISSPFIDSFNENIKVYISKETGKLYISDDGYTIWNLQSYGLPLRKNSSRYNMLKSIVNSKGLKINEDSQEIYVNVNNDNIGAAIHTLIQGIISITDLAYTNTTNVKNLFYEEVYSYFVENKPSYNFIPDIDLQGKSTLSHKFDYLFFTKKSGGNAVKLINRLDTKTVKSILFSWEDTYAQRKERYNEDLSMSVIINDKDKKINSTLISALNEYKVKDLYWSDKKTIQKELSA